SDLRCRTQSPRRSQSPRRPAHGSVPMDPRWERIRLSLVSQVEVAEQEPSFTELRVLLRAFCGADYAQEAVALARYDKQVREDLSRALADMWRRRAGLRETIASLLMLCLWRRLTRVYYEQRKYWVDAEEELAGEMTRVFLGQLGDRALLRATTVSD